jgi:hypothetical protein
MKKQITRDDLMSLDEYGKVRRERARALSERKKARRIDVGPYCTFYFENFETMLFQVQEMLYIEKGGEEQIADELAAYNPLIPQGKELVATVMIEIGDSDRREKVLAGLGGFEETISMTVAGETVPVRAEEDIDRTTADGKASSVQFVHFQFTDAQIEAFRTEGADISVSIGHENYRHAAGLSEVSRAALAADFD